MNHPLKAAGGLIAGFLLGSCGGLKDGMAATGEQTRSIASHARFSALAETPLAKLMPAGGLKVVKARNEDMKEMPSGQERAIAYRKQKRSEFWFLGGPVDFKEPPLPEPGSELDGSLLPPRMPIE